MAKHFIYNLAVKGLLTPMRGLICGQFSLALPKERNQLSRIPGLFLQFQPHISVTCLRRYAKINKPKYPPLDENELEEKFTRGGGPGGQAVATTNNCVLLRHVPTGILVRCHAERSLELNRKIARRRMQEKLDEHYNGENSIIAQEKLLAKKKLLNRKAKTKKKLERLATEKLGAKEAAELDIEESHTALADIEDPGGIQLVKNLDHPRTSHTKSKDVSEGRYNTTNRNESDT